MLFEHQDTTGMYGYVGTVRGNRVILRTRPARGCECDVDTDHARWVTPDSFEFALSGVDDRGGWLYVSGSVTHHRTHYQRIDHDPNWH